MSKLFLINKSIDIDDFIAFKSGITDLINIEKKPSHVFYKHESIYYLPILSILYSTQGYEEQEISRFIEQGFSPCENYIDTEEKADEYCKSDYNAFLGIDFTSINMNPLKCVINEFSYTKWNNSYLSKFDLFIGELGACIFNKEFEKDFKNLTKEVQGAILEKVKFCKSRGLATTLAPGTQAIKDVTQPEFVFKVMELRISSPVGIRIYYREFKGKVYIASLEQKANPDQDGDIKKAYQIIDQFL